MDKETVVEKIYEGRILRMSAERQGIYTKLYLTIYTKEPVVTMNMNHVKVITSEWTNNPNIIISDNMAAKFSRTWIHAC